MLRQGRLAFVGTPDQLIEAARGQVWLLDVTMDEWEQVASQLRMVSSRTAGKLMQLHVLAEENPLGRGKPAEPSMEDGYLAVMSGNASTAREAIYA